MAPQKKKPFSKKTASPKKIAVKKTVLKKAALKKTGSKKMSPKKNTMSKKISPKKMSPQRKTAPKKSATKKPAPKKAALKKKIESKRTAKVGERVAKKNTEAKKMSISKSSEGRAARAARRSLAKEAPSATQPRVRFLKLGNLATQRPRDGSSDLVNLLTTSAGVSDISAASGSRQLRKEAVLDVSMGGRSEAMVEDTFVSYQLDQLIEASSANSILDIITASGLPLPLTQEAVLVEASEVVAKDTFEEAMEEDASFDFELDDRLIGTSPLSASVIDIITAASGLPLPFTFPHKESSEEASTSEATFSEEIVATNWEAFWEIIATTPGAEGGPDAGLPIANHLYEGSLDQGPSASFLGNNNGSQAAQDVTSSARPRKAYLSPALIWLEEEGFPTAEMEAMDMVKALGGEMDKEAVMRRAMEKWKRMSVEEKAVWRARAKEDAKEARAKEDANTNQK